MNSSSIKISQWEGYFLGEKHHSERAISLIQIMAKWSMWNTGDSWAECILFINRIQVSSYLPLWHDPFNFIFRSNGFPSARFVLMKSVEENGITFYTNYGSRKAQEIVCIKINLNALPVLISILYSGIECKRGGDILLDATSEANTYWRYCRKSIAWNIWRIFSSKAKSQPGKLIDFISW